MLLSQLWSTLLIMPCAVILLMFSFPPHLRYTKHFDPSAHEYFYRDERTHKAQWTKPSSLGNYDVEMEDAWMLIRDSKNEGE